LQYEAIRIIQVLNKFGGAVKAGKTILRMLGMDFGQPRLPVVPLSAAEEKQLQRELDQLGFLSHCRSLE